MQAGDHLTLADTQLATTLLGAFTHLIGKQQQQQLPSILRWFATCIKQPSVAPFLGLAPFQNHRGPALDSCLTSSIAEFLPFSGATCWSRTQFSEAPVCMARTVIRDGCSVGVPQCRDSGVICTQSHQAVACFKSSHSVHIV